MPQASWKRRLASALLYVVRWCNTGRWGPAHLRCGWKDDGRVYVCHHPGDECLTKNNGDPWLRF